MKTPEAKATDLSRCLLRASCRWLDATFVFLNLLAWTDLSEQGYNSATPMPFSYSDITTFTLAGVYTY